MKEKSFLKSSTKNPNTIVIYREYRELEHAESLRTIVIPLIVPTKEEALNKKNLDLSNSPINFCYTKPLFKEKSGKKQSWYDMRLTIEDQDGLPPKEEWFYLVTDRASLLKARFEGKKVKWLNTFQNKKAIGFLIKHRFVNCEIVRDVNYVCEDEDMWNIITTESLWYYGGDKVYLKKTTRTMKDEEGIERDIWFIYFPLSLIST